MNKNAFAEEDHASELMHPAMDWSVHAALKWAQNPLSFSANDRIFVLFSSYDFIDRRKTHLTTCINRKPYRQS